MVPVLAKDKIKVISQGGDWWVMEWFFYNLAQQLAPDSVNVSHDTELGKFKWTDPWFKQALTAMKRLYDGGVYREDEMQLGQFAEAIQNFQNRKAWGFWMGGTWWAGSMNAEDLKNSNIGILPVPLIDKKGVLTFSKSTGQPYGLPKGLSAEKREAVIAFLKFLSSPQAVGVLLKNNILPAAKVPKGMAITNSLIKETVEKGNKIRGYNFRPLNGEISQTVGDQLTSCLLGHISVDAALSKIEQVQRTLKY
jgi:ABC-type glycerol-3-phosphate transport system substrate-binding protein